MDCLLDAVRDHLRVKLELKPSECDVTPDGKPNPMAWQRFLAVHPGNMTNQSVHAIDGRFSCKVTATVRTAAAPRDRKRDGGAWAIAEQILVAVHMDYDLTARAAALSANVEFVEPLCFESANYQGPVGADWFWSEGVDDDAAGIAIELSFGRARLIRYIAESV